MRAAAPSPMAGSRWTDRPLFSRPWR